MKRIDVTQGLKAIILGRLGENERTEVAFDVSDWLEEFPGATIGLYNKRHGESKSYPVVIGQPDENGIVLWTVGAREVEMPGNGECELVATYGSKVAKSAIWVTKVYDALDGTGPTPAPWSSWMTEFTMLKGAAETAASNAAGSAADAAASAEEAGTAGAEAGAAAGAEAAAPYAEAAAASATAAAGSAVSASGSAASASGSETAAAGSATAAGQSSDAAAAAAVTAVSEASAAASSATQAGNSADAAAASAAAALVAQGSAELANTSAQSAKTAAQSAAEDAQTAQGKAEDAKEAIENLGVTSSTLTPGSSATVMKIVDQQTGEVTLSFGIPQGVKGDTGSQGPAGPKGEKGDPGAGSDVIDDTAGAGDTGKTFSADKLTTMDSELKSAINVLKPAATASDVGKFLKVKTVADGKPTAFEYGEGGSGGNVIDDTAGAGVTNKTWSADKLTTMLGDIETLLAAI